MKEKEYNSWGDLINWVYANLNMYNAALDAGLSKYDRTSFSIRAKAYKSYTLGTWRIHSLYENNNWKVDMGKDVCWYCDRPLDLCGKLSVEHIFPKALGGDDNFDNIAYACSSCNSSKGKRDFIEWYNETFEHPASFGMISTYMKLLYKYSVEHGLMDKSIEEISLRALPFNVNGPLIILQWIKQSF